MIFKGIHSEHISCFCEYRFEIYRANLAVWKFNNFDFITMRPACCSTAGLLLQWSIRLSVVTKRARVSHVQCRLLIDAKTREAKGTFTLPCAVFYHYRCDNQQLSPAQRMCERVLSLKTTDVRGTADW